MTYKTQNQLMIVLTYVNFKNEISFPTQISKRCNETMHSFKALVVFISRTVSGQSYYIIYGFINWKILSNVFDLS